MNKSEILSVAKPILFNTPMVQAILDNRKTVTRRAIKPQPEMSLAYIYAGQNNGSWSYSPYDKENFEEYRHFPKYWTPPCHTDDILYVRETWHKYTKRIGKGTSCRLEQFYGYKASIANSEDSREKWRPSIHMPKEAARIFLRVTDVRVERLQDIITGDYKYGGRGISRIIRRLSNKTSWTSRKEINNGT